MPMPKKPRLLPDVKRCEECGSEFRRPMRYADSFWEKKRLCSRSCASKRGNRIRHSAGPTISDRFWRSVSQAPGQGPSGDCWEWQLGRTEAGYGRLWDGDGEVKAHRFAYEMAFGPIPAGLMVCHHCDHPPCCRPEHLFLGTNADNMADMAAKGRSMRGERHHKAKLTEDDVRAIRADARMQIDIAAAFGVTQGLVGAIKRGELWTHIT